MCHHPITTKDIKLYTKDEYKDRMDALVCGKKKHFIDDCPNKPHPRTRRMHARPKPKLLYQAREGRPQALIVKLFTVYLMAQGNIEISNFSKNNSDDEKLSYENVTKTFMFFQEDCHKQKKRRTQ